MGEIETCWGYIFFISSSHALHIYSGIRYTGQETTIHQAIAMTMSTFKLSKINSKICRYLPVTLLTTDTCADSYTVFRKQYFLNCLVNAFFIDSKI